jgi:hypothetical protein
LRPLIAYKTFGTRHRIGPFVIEPAVSRNR